MTIGMRRELRITLAGGQATIFQAAQKDPEARRAKIDKRRRTLVRRRAIDRAQRSIWVFFSGLQGKEPLSQKSDLFNKTSFFGLLYLCAIFDSRTSR
jgi:hypothetical protein